MIIKIIIEIIIIIMGTLFASVIFKIFLGSQMFSPRDCFSPSCHSAWPINNHLLLDHQWFQSPFWSSIIIIWILMIKMSILSTSPSPQNKCTRRKYCYHSHHPAPEGVHSEPLDNCSERRPHFTWRRSWGHWFHHKVSFSSFNILSLVLIPTGS